ncbi:MAG: 2-hydroxyglutaryl-CoA dehydratase [Chloroflexi bacterium]|nr:2-hydroxyglutaryl-CoA dehydratase [Chloroflexota bacterium]
MFVAGIDIGSRAAKAVVMEDGQVVSHAIIDTGAESAKTADKVLREAIRPVGLSLEDIEYTVGTGYGRCLIPFANDNISEISCHAKGVNWCMPSVRTILDMGGQDCKAIRCDAMGRVVSFVMNDKCAGGTGRFLEVIADILRVPLEGIGELSLESKEPIPFNTICAVFAKSEALTLQKRGVAKSDILAGLHEAIATRAYNLLRRVSPEPEFTISGGIAKNAGMVAKVKAKLKLEPVFWDEPQIMGALGAAVFAAERSALAASA